MRTWDRDAIERVEKLAARGYSAAQVGEKMGRTRNAVLGCAYRYQIQFKSGPEVHRQQVIRGMTK